MPKPDLAPPPSPAPDGAVTRKRRVAVWLWIALGLVALVASILLAPIFALAALAVLITGIVALAKSTRTWLRFRSKKAAVVTTAVAAVVFLISSLMTGVVYPSVASDEKPAALAPRSGVPLSTEPTADSEPTVAPATDDEDASADVSEDARSTADITTGQTALELLAALEVKGRAPKTGYDRDQFGQRWLDVDRNGCDTRNDILARDLVDEVLSGRCKVMSGVLADPFTGTMIAFVRGQGTSELVQIDHVVALSDAWQKGAQQLTADQRASFANDPLNLLAVDGSANAQKGDGDAATWLPKNKAFRCAYVARQVSVKTAYGLWVTQAEHDAIERVLSACPDEPAVTSELATQPVVRAVEPTPVEPAPEPAQPAQPAPAPAQPAPAPAPVEPAPAQPEPAPAPVDVSYANCDAVRAAGAAPIHQGQPGYSTKLDRDKDGIACDT